MLINLSEIAKFDISSLYEYLDPSNPEGMSDFFKSPKDHYRLLAYLSTLFNNSVLVDIGSHMGHSALALSYNKTNTIVSFDIVDRVLKSIKRRPNIIFHTRHFNDGLSDIFSSKLVLIDTNHEGVHEYALYNDLRHNNWSGLLLIDDIW